MGDDARKLRMWTNDCEWVIAYDVEDIRAILNAAIGDDEWSEQWREEDDAKSFTFVDEDDGTNEEKTMAEWIVLRGRGYFAVEL